MIFLSVVVKLITMILYHVTWSHNKSLSKGKGRVTSDEVGFNLLVLCRNITHAQSCLLFYFDHVFSKYNKHGLTLDDGEVKFSRMVIDSRGFIAHYLFLDGMREPINLVDVSSNLLRSDRIFGHLK